MQCSVADLCCFKIISQLAYQAVLITNRPPPIHRPNSLGPLTRNKVTRYRFSPLREYSPAPSLIGKEHRMAVDSHPGLFFVTHQHGSIK
jgi:hypothetical protein